MKSFLASKTVWFNTLSILVVVATFFGYVPNQELMAKVSAGLLMIAPLINLVLRFYTSKGVYIR